MGKILNVERMITGEISALLGAYYTNIRFINVQTGEIEAAHSAKTKSITGLEGAVTNLVRRLVRSLKPVKEEQLKPPQPLISIPFILPPTQPLVEESSAAAVAPAPSVQESSAPVISPLEPVQESSASVVLPLPQQQLFQPSAEESSKPVISPLPQQPEEPRPVQQATPEIEPSIKVMPEIAPAKEDLLRLPEAQTAPSTLPVAQPSTPN